MELFKEHEVEPPLAAYLQAQKEGRHVAPYVPTWDLAPLSLLCKKALAWNAVGFTEEAGELAHFLLPYEEFLPLWCPESKFDEEALKRLFSSIKAIPPMKAEPPKAGASFFQSFSFAAAFNLAGKGSLGVIRAGNVEIRAMGPQLLPLSDASQFGIGGQGINGWTSSLANPEIWLKAAFGVRDEECSLALQFVGITPEKPLAFSFYIKAPGCRVGDEVLKPKTLTRLQREGKQLQFNHIVIESSSAHKIQIIPLAGFGGFWNCDFLAAFEIHHLEPQVTFSIRVS